VNPSYPLLLRLSGRPVTVVGGGRVAARRVPALLDAGAVVTVVAPALHPSLALAVAEGGRVVAVERRYRDGDLAGAWLAHACTDDAAANAAVTAEADRRGIFCVRADDRDAATAWLPAVARSGDVVVAVNAGGAPARARALRDQAADALFGPARDAGVEPAAGRDRQPATGWVALVGAGPGDPGLLTLRAKDVLGAADVVLVDRLVDRGALAFVRPDCQVVDVGKRGWATKAGEQQAAIERLIVDSALAGRGVVRLKGGDPFVFGRGGEEALACIRAGVRLEVVPGVTSAVAVPAYAGIPVTMRGFTHDVAVVSGHLDPDDAASRVRWRALAEGPATLVVLMGLATLPAICAALVAGGRPEGTPAACIARGTTAGQRVVVGDLATLPDLVERAALPSPAVTVVGDVVRLREQLRWFPEAGQVST
jgi:uroporphyrin-III C-methyltransferase/precorrin-2 dehydrogenase/sirohydrochlorin ferrochelatase